MVDSNKKLVEAEAKYRNDRLKGRGMKPRYRVEERYPVALAFVFSGTGSAYSATYAKGQERRNNGC